MRKGQLCVGKPPGSRCLPRTAGGPLGECSTTRDVAECDVMSRVVRYDMFQKVVSGGLAIWSVHHTEYVSDSELWVRGQRFWVLGLMGYGIWSRVCKAM